MQKVWYNKSVGRKLNGGTLKVQIGPGPTGPKESGGTLVLQGLGFFVCKQARRDFKVQIGPGLLNRDLKRASCALSGIAQSVSAR